MAFITQTHPGINSSSSGAYLFTFVVSTTGTDQQQIDEQATSLGLEDILTMSGFATTELGISFGLLDDPSIPGFMMVISLMCLSLSLVGYSLIIAMQLYKDRRAIGLFRVRGFQGKIVSKLYLTEHLFPLIVGVILGIVCGILGGLFFMNLALYDFKVFHGPVNVPFVSIPGPFDLILFIAIPIR